MFDWALNTPLNSSLQKWGGPGIITILMLPMEKEMYFHDGNKVAIVP